MAISRLLDRVYDAAGVLAGIAMIAIVLIILAQVGARLLAYPLRGGAQFAGYAMAAASFLALPHAFRRHAHIRITILLQALPPRPRLVLDLAGLAVGTVIAAWFAWWAYDLAYISWEIGEVSQGDVAVAMWIPQIAMVVGTALFAVALCHTLIETALTGHGFAPEGDGVLDAAADR
ncbi:C4-dicarboxylate ABC transporter substrate-binding protein [Tistrella bauzanensis]|uniref:TRAP transporter small permease protein n=1 Tax=Tistrella bauzanensis TaxID=657419 RepID=A0ABQ1I8L7_9PROT|nr:TRAP transporter small permease subunit [Tistrella bauzanensis]GGB23434.1 C4-dicarboxylate ABC transporter substrate-binding protein [Tistrella bauzanensis]